MMILLYLILLIIPGISTIKLIINYKKLKSTFNKKDLSGFEIANKIVNEDIYIVEVRDSLLNTFYDMRNTIKFSTKVFHESNILSTMIAAKIAYTSNERKSLSGNLLQYMDIANLLSYLFFMIALLYSFEFIYLAIAILLVSYFITFNDMINNQKCINDSFEYLVKNKIVDKDYEYLINVIKYENVARIIIVLIDFINKMIKKIRTMFK